MGADQQLSDTRAAVFTSMFLYIQAYGFSTASDDTTIRFLLFFPFTS